MHYFVLKVSDYNKWLHCTPFAVWPQSRCLLSPDVVTRLKEFRISTAHLLHGALLTPGPKNPSGPASNIDRAWGKIQMEVHKLRDLNT